VPSVLRLDGLRVTIYPNDHRPAHVHVIGGGGEAVFLLNCPSGPVDLRESYGFTGPKLAGIASGLDEAVKSLCEAWESILGPY
jgi:hypothetical protein